MNEVRVKFVGSHVGENARWVRIAKDQWRLEPLGKNTLYRHSIVELLYDPNTRTMAGTLRSRHGGERFIQHKASDLDAAKKLLLHDLKGMTANPEWVTGFDDHYRATSPADDLSPSTQPPHDYALEWVSRFSRAINDFERAYAALARPAYAAGISFKPSKPASEARDHLEWRISEFRRLVGERYFTSCKGSWEWKRLTNLFGWATALTVLHPSDNATPPLFSDKPSWLSNLAAIQTFNTAQIW